MFGEFFDYMLTPAPKAVLAMGFLKEAVGIRGRYKRCKEHWQEHLDRTRATILRGAERSRAFRKAVILGAGLLHDIPLEQLSQRFREVILVDVVHPFGSRWNGGRFGNVRRLTADITNTVEQVYARAWDPHLGLPKSEPNLFLDDPEVDFTASVNLLSQLPCMPMVYLRKQRTYTETAIMEYALDLIRAHLRYLSSLPGVVTLVTDLERIKQDALRRVVERRDLLYGIPLEKSGEEWEWKLAPMGEVDARYSYFRRVIGIPDWK